MKFSGNSQVLKLAQRSKTERFDPTSVIFLEKSTFFNSCRSLIKIQLQHLQARMRRMFGNHLLRFNPVSNGENISNKKCCGFILTLVKSGILLCFIFIFNIPKQSKLPYCMKGRTEPQHKQYNSQEQADTVLNSLCSS